MRGTHDYGVRKAVRWTPAQWAVLVIALIPGVAFALWLWLGGYLKHRAEHIERAGEVSLAAPPCAAITREQYQAGLRRPAKATVTEDVTFYRQFGHVECGLVHYNGGRAFSSYMSCQFTSPGLLRVVTPKGEWFFDPGLAQPATIGAPHGQATCVAASNFRIN